MIYWMPRGLAVLFIAFLTLFSLDVFDMQLGFWQTAMALLIHNIPSLALLAVLLISWRREWVGGVVFILAGLLYIFFGIKGAPTLLMALSWSLIIAGPSLLIGTLFFIGWRYNNRHDE